VRKLPFRKALIYFAVVRCRIDFEQPSLLSFMQALNEYFPFICFDSPFAYVQDELNRIPNIPTSVIKGNYNKNSLHRFLKESSLTNLHDLIERQQFQDLMYDVDLRRKVDGMAISGFRPMEIELEIKQYIQDIDPVVIKTYLDCFADYSDMDYHAKRNFIIQSFEEPLEQKIMIKCIENKSKDMVRMFLGVNSRTMNPIELINKTAQIITLKTQEGLVENDEVKIQNYLKLSIKVADVLQKFGAGNEDAAKQLLAALSKKPEDVGVTSPKPMSVEQLEDMFLENIKPPQA
jgi:hypothetical protein